MFSMKQFMGVLCLSTLTASPIYAARPAPIKNTVKYKDAGAKPATGRSGSAAIQVLALRGQDTTDIQVTTGEIGSNAPAPGKLDKVQLKVFNTSGDAILVNNFHPKNIPGAGGNFFVEYGWPLPGQRLQVQANVSGIDPKRTDVVTVNTEVKFRPDLTVASINTPGQALQGSVVTITAVVRETNGDLGARANCVLKADGAVIDHADNIWVDAGDAVTVQFRHAFDTLGAKHLSVELTNVTPADYNTSNNSANATLDIISASSPLYWTVNADDTVYDQTASERYHEEFTPSVPEATGYVRDQVGGHHDHTRVVDYGANLQTEKPIAFPVQIESTLTIDGNLTENASGTIDENPNSFMNFSGDGYWNRCGDYYDGWHFLFVCHFHSEFDGVIRDLSTVYSGSSAGVVTYASYGTSTTRYDDGTTDVYTYNGTSDYVSGEIFSPLPDPLGNNIQIHESFTDAAGDHHEAGGSVQLSPLPDYTLDYGEYCYNYDYDQEGWGHYSGYQCMYPITLVHPQQGWNSGIDQY